LDSSSSSSSDAVTSSGSSCCAHNMLTLDEEAVCGKYGGLAPVRVRVLLQQLLSGMKLSLLMSGRQEEALAVIRWVWWLASWQRALWFVLTSCLKCIWRNQHASPQDYRLQLSARQCSFETTMLPACHSTAVRQVAVITDHQQLASCTCNHCHFG
jgi:hypothetical protein